MLSDRSRSKLAFISIFPSPPRLLAGLWPVFVTTEDIHDYIFTPTPPTFCTPIFIEEKANFNPINWGAV